MKQTELVIDAIKAAMQSVDEGEAFTPSAYDMGEWVTSVFNAIQWKGITIMPADVMSVLKLVWAIDQEAGQHWDEGWDVIWASVTPWIDRMVCPLDELPCSR